MTDNEKQLNDRIDNLESKLDLLLSIVQSQGQFPSVCSYTFGEWLVKWFDLYKKPKNRKNSLRDTENYIVNNLIPELGSVPVSQLTGNMIQRYLNKIDRPNTQGKLADIINGSLRKLVDLGDLPRNPFNAVELPTYKGKHYIPIEFDQQIFILRAMTNEFYTSVFWVMCCTGLRISEFLAILRNGSKAIDYKRHVIHVTQAVDIDTNVLNDYTKTDSSTRNIPFLKSLERHLQVIQKYAKQKAITYNAVKCYFRKIYKKLNFDGLNLHSFRHTFVSMCYYVGMKLKRIQMLAGHASADVTMNIYTTLLENGNSPLLDYIRELENVLENGPGKFVDADFEKA